MINDDSAERGTHNVLTIHFPFTETLPGLAPWRVADLTLTQIRRLDAGSWFDAKHKGEPVPTLGETLRAMSTSRPGLPLEIKAPGLYRGIETRYRVDGIITNKPDLMP